MAVREIKSEFNSGYQEFWGKILGTNKRKLKLSCKKTT